jgi:prolyl 4-hydroxylase
MSNVDLGDAIVFNFPKIRILARKGDAVFWYDVDTSEKKHPETLHAGCPVLLGNKRFANKWIREYGQEFRRPCLADYTEPTSNYSSCSNRNFATIVP